MQQSTFLMTTGAMVLGAVPLAIATGAESRHQIGWVIVGGISLGTLLTVFVVPTIYTLLARKHARAKQVPFVCYQSVSLQSNCVVKRFPCFEHGKRVIQRNSGIAGEWRLQFEWHNFTIGNHLTTC